MYFDILTIFPEFFETPLKTSILKRAIESKKIEVFLHDIREFGQGPHQQVDDIPYGGGAGMVFKPEPVYKTIQSIPKRGEKKLNILLSARGEPLTQSILAQLLAYDQILLVAPRYEGIDQRVVDLAIDREISLGDYVLTGGEIPALALLDGITRLIPGVLGNEASIEYESFSQEMLECSHYTRPANFMGMEVPDVLRSGDHKKIENWRRKNALKITQQRRPDLLNRAELTSKEKDCLKVLKKDKSYG